MQAPEGDVLDYCLFFSMVIYLILSKAFIFIQGFFFLDIRWEGFLASFSNLIQYHTLDNRLLTKPSVAVFCSLASSKKVRRVVSFYQVMRKVNGL